MPYVIPTFNLTCNVWHSVAGLYVDYTLPDVVVQCNLTPGRRVMHGEAFPVTLRTTEPMILLPLHTDIRAFWNTLVQDLVEVPAGSNRFYQVNEVDDIGKGFANEHRFAGLHYLPNGATFNVQGAIPAPIPLP